MEWGSKVGGVGCGDVRWFALRRRWWRRRRRGRRRKRRRRRSWWRVLCICAWGGRAPGGSGAALGEGSPSQGGGNPRGRPQGAARGGGAVFDAQVRTSRHVPAVARLGEVRVRVRVGVRIM